MASASGPVAPTALSLRMSGSWNDPSAQSVRPNDAARCPYRRSIDGVVESVPRVSDRCCAYDDSSDSVSCPSGTSAPSEINSEPLPEGLIAKRSRLVVNVLFCCCANAAVLKNAVSPKISPLRIVVPPEDQHRNAPKQREV